MFDIGQLDHQHDDERIHGELAGNRISRDDPGPVLPAVILFPSFFARKQSLITSLVSNAATCAHATR